MDGLGYEISIINSLPTSNYQVSEVVFAFFFHRIVGILLYMVLSSMGLYVSNWFGLVHQLRCN